MKGKFMCWVFGHKYDYIRLRETSIYGFKHCWICRRCGHINVEFNEQTISLDRFIKEDSKELIGCQVLIERLKDELKSATNIDDYSEIEKDINNINKLIIKLEKRQW